MPVIVSIGMGNIVIRYLFVWMNMKRGKIDVMQEILTAFREKSAEFANRHRLNTMEAELKFRGLDNGLEIRCPFEKFTLAFVWMYRGNHPADFSHKNILSCRLYFDDELPIYCLLYDIIDLLDENDFRCFFFPYIESLSRFTSCFDVLLSAVDKYLPRIIALSEDDAVRRMVIDRVRRDVCAIVPNSRIFEISEDELRLSKEIKPDYLEKCLAMYHAGVRVRFGGSAYNYYLCGDYRRALKSFSAFKSHTYYEKRLMTFMGGLLESGSSYEAVDERANSLNYGMLRRGGYGVILRIAVLCALSMPIILLGYMAEYYTTVFVTTGENIIFNTAVLLRNSLLPCVAVSAVGTVLLGYFFWLNRYKICLGRQKENALEHTTASKYELLRPTLKKASNVLYIVSVVYVALAACDGCSFAEGGLYDRRGLFTIQGVYYSYDEVDKISSVEHNDLFGETVSYSFRMRDGTVIDIRCGAQNDKISRLKKIWESREIEIISQK
ncbi:MAG: hypothetical protein ACI4IJ_09585 [Acutalibacteraceae bacterium]